LFSAGIDSIDGRFFICTNLPNTICTPHSIIDGVGHGLEQFCLCQFAGLSEARCLRLPVACLLPTDCNLYVIHKLLFALRFLSFSKAEWHSAFQSCSLLMHPIG
jgi:hypothetical protein